MSDCDARVGTAYHESGHAVIARTFGQSVKRVSIAEDESSIGRVLNAPPPRWVSEVLEAGIQPAIDDLRVRRWLERRIMISFAGTLAEEKKTGNSGSSGFGEVALTDVERARLPVHVDADVMHTVSPHSDLAMILDLVKRMAGSPNEQDAYCEWLRLRTSNLLEQPPIWDQIDAVAVALLERKTLTGRQLRAVIQEWNLAHVEARPRPSGGN